MTEAPPALPEARTLNFDFWDDTVCVPERSDLIAEAPPVLTELLTGVLPDDGKSRGAYDLHALLTDARRNLADEASDDLRYELDELISDTARHLEDCGCSSDAWPFVREAMDEFLGTLPGTWGFLGNDEEFLRDADAMLDTNELSELALGSTRGGWRELTLEWDGTSTLKVSVQGQSWGTSLTGRMLDEVQAEAAEALEVAGADYPRCLALRHPPAPVLFAAAAFETCEHVSDTEWIEDVVETTVNAWPLTDAQIEAFDLLVESWTSSFSELLTSAIGVGVQPALAP